MPYAGPLQSPRAVVINLTAVVLKDLTDTKVKCNTFWLVK